MFGEYGQKSFAHKNICLHLNLCRQQPEKDKQNIFAPPWKISSDAHGCSILKQQHLLHSLSHRIGERPWRFRPRIDCKPLSILVISFSFPLHRSKAEMKKVALWTVRTLMFTDGSVW